MCIRDRANATAPTPPVVNDNCGRPLSVSAPVAGADPVSYTHLRAHETGRNLVCRLQLEKKNYTISAPVVTMPAVGFFFNDTATTEIYTRSLVGSVRCV